MEIPIYDKDGVQVDSILIEDEIEYVDGRVCKSNSCYYKGIGVPYTSHNIIGNITDAYEFIEYSSVFYIGNVVSKRCYQNKFGIFQERYQPHFTDWIGCCGIKELNILENLYDENKFERNSIDVLGYEVVNEENKQYYIKAQYSCGRKFYLDEPSPQDLRDLIDYMIINDWNFPWDKDSITDISYNGLVTDVADLFHSNELIHKIGTVYSVLYSLGNSNPKYYDEFCLYNSLRNTNQMDYVFNTIYLLMQNKIDIDELLDLHNPVDMYKNVVKNYLIIGKNCGFCGVGSCKNRIDNNKSYGNEIRNEYIKRVNRMLQ